MEKIKDEIVIGTQFIMIISIWLIVLLLTNTPFIMNFNALRKIPDAISVYSFLVVIFIKWAWRIPIFQGWLVQFPDLEGTWEGTLQTTWINPKTKKVPDPVRLVLVVKQCFNSISCVMYTKESYSYSTTANFLLESDSGIKELSYVYTNRPDGAIRGRSSVHDGAAILSIISKPERKLKGEYWTNRKTTGSITLMFKTKELLEGFPNKQ